MVNYCCVTGCNRNSRLNKHLNYYSLPKERQRQVTWLKAAGRDDLLEKEGKLTVSHRFCSRHFMPSSIKNRNLCPDAVPTLCLPGTGSDHEEDSEEDPLPHTDIICDNCNAPIVGYRYKCVSCADYDLCQKCEMLEAHSHHYMLRIPKPLKFKLADNLVNKWQKFFKVEHGTPDSDKSEMDSASESDDDEPITKYAKNYDSGIDLSEDIKNKIRKEVTRALKVSEAKRKSKRKRDEKSTEEDTETPSKVMKTEDCIEIEEHTPTQPVAFADVNEIKDGMAMDLKPEYPLNNPAPQVAVDPSPVMHVKLSDDLSELMIEVTSNNQKTVYKYSDRGQIESLI